LGLAFGFWVLNASQISTTKKRIKGGEEIKMGVFKQKKRESWKNPRASLPSV